MFASWSALNALPAAGDPNPTCNPNYLQIYRLYLLTRGTYAELYAMALNPTCPYTCSHTPICLNVSMNLRSPTRCATLGLKDLGLGGFGNPTQTAVLQEPG